MKLNPYKHLSSRQVEPARAPAGTPAASMTPDVRQASNSREEQLFDANGAYNPPAFAGWKDSLQGALPNCHSRLFDKRGTLNAYDNKDALTQISHLLQNVSRSSDSRNVFARRASLASEEKRKVIAAALQDDEGFKVLGQELLLPIKDLVDYEGWIRKVLRVRPLAQAELFRLAKDVRATAFTIGQDGQGLESRATGRFITPDEFKIASFPTVDISDIYHVNYDILDRMQDTARQEIELEEDKRGLALLDTAARAVNTVTTFASLGIGALEDVKYQVERHRLVAEKFLINRQELSDVIKTMSTQVDPVTERELILAGFVGSVLNCQIITSAGTGVEEVVPAGTFYCCTGAEHLGEMGIRIELFSEPFNTFAQRGTAKGWIFLEMLGFAISNPRACSVGVK